MKAWQDNQFRSIYSEAQIATRIKEMGQEISKDYADITDPS